MNWRRWFGLKQRLYNVEYIEKCSGVTCRLNHAKSVGEDFAGSIIVTMPSGKCHLIPLDYITGTVVTTPIDVPY